MNSEFAINTDRFTNKFLLLTSILYVAFFVFFYVFANDSEFGAWVPIIQFGIAVEYVLFWNVINRSSIKSSSVLVFKVLCINGYLQPFSMKSVFFDCHVLCDMLLVMWD